MAGHTILTFSLPLWDGLTSERGTGNIGSDAQVRQEVINMERLPRAERGEGSFGGCWG